MTLRDTNTTRTDKSKAEIVDSCFVFIGTHRQRSRGVSLFSILLFICLFSHLFIGTAKKLVKTSVYLR